MRRSTLTPNILGAIVAAVAITVSCVSAAAAAPVVEPGAYPVSQLRVLAAQYAPGVAVPTKLPAGVVQFRLGPGRLHGVAGRANYEIDFEKDGSSLLGFKVDVFSGSRVAAVTAGVASYLKKGGWTVTSAPFVAGSYRGTVQHQKNGALGFEMYAWASRGQTYVLTTYVMYGGKQQNPWSKKNVIASFKST